jgi:hypothetical protein
MNIFKSILKNINIIFNYLTFILNSIINGLQILYANKNKTLNFLSISINF